MIYTQHLDGCYLEEGEKILHQSNASKNALSKFRDTYKKEELPPLSLVEQTEDIKAFIKSAASHQFEDILILGTGGSSLGGQALYALSTQDKPRLHFMDNIDPFTFDAIFKKVNLKTTGVIAISKSGSTVETLMQLLTCLERFQKENLKSHFLVITEPTDNPLRKIAQSQNWTCLEHPTSVGGRYSCFSIVGLLPAILAGIDVFAFRKGAQNVLHQHLTEEYPPALKGSVLTVHLHKNHQKSLSVMLPYSDQLQLFSLWYCQLWAESLGKKGQGTTPISALGTVDQHSQLQLYLDGPKDKFFTIIAPSWKGKGDKINLSLIPEFTGKTMGDLFAAEQKATYETLIRHKCPTRLITIDNIDPQTLGGLMMHFMIETILTSYLLDVNAFDQPAVEEGKRLAREFLADENS
ncbi:MAG: glucose-6-phosphate isomerase [Proteobacteria bacterium]|nr:glucose-6-phosphate isomerase [Pseudomonadota bacterium]